MSADPTAQRSVTCPPRTCNDRVELIVDSIRRSWVTSRIVPG